MKKNLLLLLASTTSIFASNLNTTTPEKKPETNLPLSRKILPYYSLIKFSVINDGITDKNLFLEFSSGIQTKPQQKENEYFHALRTCVNISISQDRGPSDIFVGICSTFMHYLNDLESTTRFFWDFGLGFQSNFCSTNITMAKLFEKDGENGFISYNTQVVDDNGIFFGLLGGGIELGKLNSLAICGLNFTIEQPILYFFQPHEDNLYMPRFKTGCFIGF